MTVRDEIKSALESNKVLIGTKRIIKDIKTKDLNLVIVASNCPDEIKKDLMHYSKIVDLKVQEFDGTSKELGTFCGKPFPIATIAIKK